MAWRTSSSWPQPCAQGLVGEVRDGVIQENPVPGIPGIETGGDPLPFQPAGNLRHLLTWIKENLLKERPELFVQGDSVRPGILVLINDADWELMGNLDYQLQDRDHVVFISTLHGG
ncbi:hypothetical protein Chor_004318 [Crotalus horridus]